MSMQITAIPLDKVEYDPDQPRKNKPQQDVNALANSIALKGLLNPIHARHDGNGGFVVIDGETRTRACKQLGMKEVHAIVINDDDLGKTPEEIRREIFSRQVLANTARFDMSVMDTIHAYQRAMDLGISIVDCAKAFGTSVSTIEKDLPLINLPVSFHRELDQKSISKEIARKLADLVGEYSDSEIADAWKYAKRAPSAEGQSKRLEVWKTNQAGEVSALDKTKDETTTKERKRNASQVSKFLTTFRTFSKKIKDDDNFLSSAMLGLHKRVDDGSFAKDLNFCVGVLDEIKEAIVEYQAQKK